MMEKKDEAIDALVVAISLNLQNVKHLKDEKDFDNIINVRRHNKLLKQYLC